MYLEIMELWLNALKIPNDSYTIKFDENEMEIIYELLVDKEFIGRVFGSNKNNYIQLKKLLNSTFIKYGKKVNYYINER